METVPTIINKRQMCVATAGSTGPSLFCVPCGCFIIMFRPSGNQGVSASVSSLYDTSVSN